MDNQPFIDLYDKRSQDEPEEYRQRHRPTLKKEIQRNKIVKINTKQMIFEKGGLDRVR